MNLIWERVLTCARVFVVEMAPKLKTPSDLRNDSMWKTYVRRVAEGRCVHRREGHAALLIAVHSHRATIFVVSISIPCEKLKVNIHTTVSFRQDHKFPGSYTWLTCNPCEMLMGRVLTVIHASRDGNTCTFRQSQKRLLWNPHEVHTSRLATTILLVVLQLLLIRDNLWWFETRIWVVNWAYT
jgi:hypothetical protein